MPYTSVPVYPDTVCRHGSLPWCTLTQSVAMVRCRGVPLCTVCRHEYPNNNGLLQWCTLMVCCHGLPRQSVTVYTDTVCCHGVPRQSVAMVYPDSLLPWCTPTVCCHGVPDTVCCHSVPRQSVAVVYSCTVCCCGVPRHGLLPWCTPTQSVAVVYRDTVCRHGEPRHSLLPWCTPTVCCCGVPRHGLSPWRAPTVCCRVYSLAACMAYVCALLFVRPGSQQRPRASPVRARRSGPVHRRHPHRRSASPSSFSSTRPRQKYTLAGVGWGEGGRIGISPHVNKTKIKLVLVEICEICSYA